jgi:hypothetical protein
MPQTESDLLVVHPTDPVPVAAAKRLLQALVKSHRMYLNDAAEKSTIELVADHFARHGTAQRKPRSFLDN